MYDTDLPRLSMSHLKFPKVKHRNGNVVRQNKVGDNIHIFQLIFKLGDKKLGEHQDRIKGNAELKAGQYFANHLSSIIRFEYDQ